MNENDKKSFLIYAEAILAECHKARFKNGISGSVKHSNMEEKIKEPEHFYVLGYTDGQEKIAKELLSILTILETIERKHIDGIVKHALLKIAGDKRWQVKKK